MKMDVRENGRHIDDIHLDFVPRIGDVITLGYKAPVYEVKCINLWNDSNNKTNVSIHVTKYKNRLEAQMNIPGFD